MPIEVYIDSEKRPQVSVDADRVEKADGYLTFYKGSEVVASFKLEKVIGYVKLAPVA
jgi:hypothetical protein